MGSEVWYMEIVRVFRKIWGIVIVILVIAAGMCILKQTMIMIKRHMIIIAA